MDHIEKRILGIIEANAEKIIAFGDDIWRHAEVGFQETRTSQKFSEQMEQLGFQTETGLAITGVKAYLKEKQEDEVRIALMGELDALPIGNHPEACPETGAVHACGHNAQLTGVMGAALALADPEVKSALGGNIAFMGVPSEEASSAPEVKQELMESGKIKYVGGKCEFIRLGVMDDIGLTVGHHIVGDGHEYAVNNARSMGNMGKHITFTGIASHPAFAHKVADAQLAAILAIQNVNAQRESMEHFYAWNKYILHGVILNGGKASNIVCDRADMAYDIRGFSAATMQDLSYRVDRALRGAAVTTGAGLEIKTTPGYLPTQPVKNADIVREVFALIDPEQKHKVTECEAAGTSDYGDLSSIMPVLQFYTGGHNGAPTHTVDYKVADPYEYYVTPAKCFALLAYRLLKDGAARAKTIISENKPLMTKAEYLELMESFRKTERMDMVLVPDFGLVD